MNYLSGLLLLLSLSGYSQHSNSIVGVWTGTSLCQVKDSPCKNEIVVYHIMAGTSKNSFTVQMNKIINGLEEEMGSLDFIYSDSLNNFVGKNYDRLKREAVWTFKMEGPTLKGTLTVEGGKLYRIIEVKKEK